LRIFSTQFFSHRYPGQLHIQFDRFVARSFSPNAVLRFSHLKIGLPHCRSNTNNNSVVRATDSRMVPIAVELNWLKMLVGRGSRDPRPGSPNNDIRSKSTLLPKLRPFCTYRLVHPAVKLSAKGSLVTHFIESTLAHTLASSKRDFSA
jgi:hypothetical protein